MISARRRLAAVLTGREALPEGFTGTLATGERVLADASGPARGGEPGRIVLCTDRGLWIDDHRIPWHLVVRATWAAGALEVVEADETEHLDGGVVVLAERPPRRLPLPDAGRVPETVHRRVTDGIRTREHVSVGDGGAWFVQRRVTDAGGSRVTTQVRPDPGTDPAALRTLAAGVGEKLRDGTR